MSEIDQRIHDLSVPVSSMQAMLLCGCFVLSILLFVIAWGSERSNIRPVLLQIRFKAALLISFAFAGLGFWLAMPYAIHIFRVVPEEPPVIEPVMNLAISSFLYNLAISEKNGGDKAAVATFACLRGLSYSLVHEKSQCQIQPQCAKFLAGDKLAKAELIALLEQLKQNTQNISVKNQCSSVDFAKFGTSP